MRQHQIIVCLTGLLVFTAWVQIGAAAPRVEANRLFEHTFTAAKEHDDPFNTVKLDVLFVDAKGKRLLVPAFWDGGKTWKVRYSSPLVGKHTFKTVCSVKDAGLHGIEGAVEVVPYTGDNPLYKRGPICVAKDKRHFTYGDGTPFFWLADTWWMGLCKRLHWPDDVKTLAADRKRKGFNVIQLVVGFYPDMSAFDPRGENEAGFPWEKDYSSLRPEYFQKADQRLFYLADQGFVSCIVGSWGYHLPWMGTENMKRHWRHLIARYGALPVVWCIGGEVENPYYSGDDRKEKSELQKQEWPKVCIYVRQTDPYGRLITVHPGGSRLSRLVVDDSLLDFDMAHTGHYESLAVDAALTAKKVNGGYQATPVMPVINAEPNYEALVYYKDNITAFAARRAAWISLMLNGAAGHTYGGNGIWQVNRKEKPFGPSPSLHGGNWGHIAWDEAMILPGSQQVALAAKLLQQYQWHRFQPHPQWATWETPHRHAAVIPYSAGIPGKVRIIYMPEPLPIKVHGLETNGSYTATHFDPVNGKRTRLGPVNPAADGTWRCAAPQTDHDWVLIIER